MQFPTHLVQRFQQGAPADDQQLVKVVQVGDPEE